MTAIVLRGDARRLPLPDASVDLIVTSPPYWALRSYSDNGEHYNGQIGSEATPQEYLEALWSCTAEWARVLKPEGSMFVDLGDKYDSGTTTARVNPGTVKDGTGQGWNQGTPRVSTGRPKSLLLLPERYRIGCLDRLGLIAREVIEWDKCNPIPESAKDRCGRTHEDVVHLVKQPRYFAATDEIREPHSENTNPGWSRSVGSKSGNGTRHRTFAGDTTASNPLGKIPGSVWRVPSAPLVVPERIAHERCCGGRKRGGCEDGLAHYAAFPPALVTPIILGWSPSGICLECDGGRFPVATAVALDMSRPQARRAHQLAQSAGLTENHLLALVSVGISDTGRGAATQTGTGKNTAEVYELAAEARAALGGYAREYLLRRPTEFGYACACTPCTDHPGSAGRERTGQGYARETGRDAHPHGGVGMLPRTGPWREYHFDGWVPPPTRPAVVVDPFGGTGTTSLVADVLGRIGITIDRSMDYGRLATWRTRDPGERARALGVPKPPPVPPEQGSLFDEPAA